SSERTFSWPHSFETFSSLSGIMRSYDCNTRLKPQAAPYSSTSLVAGMGSCRGHVTIPTPRDHTTQQALRILIFLRRALTAFQVWLKYGRDN
ncbi:Uncharacterized protein FKW44_024649, partial [Caligus rogercresseyi]